MEWRNRNGNRRGMTYCTVRKVHQNGSYSAMSGVDLAWYIEKLVEVTLLILLAEPQLIDVRGRLKSRIKRPVGFSTFSTR